MDDLQFNVLFNSISVISGRRADDYERQCAMEPRLSCIRLQKQNTPFIRVINIYMPEVFMLVGMKVSEYLQYHQTILAEGCRE